MDPYGSVRLFRADDADLLTDLYRGHREPSPWRTFLIRLAGRCGADSAYLLMSDGDAVSLAASGELSLTFDMSQLSRLRPSRVYAFDELNGALARSPHGRLVRVNGENNWSAWLIIAREAGDFAAASGALLSALAPHVAIAAGHKVEMDRMLERVAITEDLLRRASITWRTSDQAIAADTWPSQDLEFASPTARQTQNDQASVVRTPDQREVLLVSEGAARPFMAMRPRGEMRSAQVQSIAALWSLSRSEARFAMTVAEGKTLTEAAQTLGLTVETARNYSKRIYAKTGARGLPDLVRLVLSSVAMLA